MKGNKLSVFINTLNISDKFNDKDVSKCMISYVLVDKYKQKLCFAFVSKK